MPPKTIASRRWSQHSHDLIQFSLIMILLILPPESYGSFSYLTRALSFFSTMSNTTTSSSYATISTTSLPPPISTSIDSVNAKLTPPKTVNNPHQYNHYYLLGNNSNGEGQHSNTMKSMLNETMADNNNNNNRLDGGWFNQFLSHFYSYNNSNISLNFYSTSESFDVSTTVDYLSSSSSSSSSESKSFEVVIRNDKTLAHLKFDKNGKDVIYCELIDLEKEPPMFRLPMVIAIRRPITVNHKTMLEAVRRCTSLSLDKYYSEQNNRTSESFTLDPLASIESTSNVTNGLNKTGDDFIESPTTASTITITKSQSFDYNAQLWTFSRGILPGTKWCGLGDLADHYEDLGYKVDIDLCCRAHDHCPIRLKAFRTGYGVFNFSFYSRLHCDCDEDFYHCLKKSPNGYAAMLGNLYFNILKIQCLKEDLTPVSVSSSAGSAAKAGSSSSSSSSATFPLQKICLKSKKTPHGTQDCVEHGIIPEAGNRMKIVAFGRHF